MDLVLEKLEPLVIHVRSGANCEELRDEIVSSLSKDHGFINLNVNECINGENARGTELGKKFYSLVNNSKVIPSNLIV